MKVFYESDYIEALTHKDWLDSLFRTLTYEEDTAPTGQAPGFVQPANKPLETPDETRVRVAVALGLAPLAGIDTGADAKQVDKLALALRQRLYPKLDRLEEAAEESLAADTAPAENAAELKGELPEGFPGLKALAALDPPVHTYHQARKLIATGADWYKDIEGIGKPTAEKIEAAAGAAPVEDEE